jgi:NTE family protein
MTADGVRRGLVMGAGGALGAAWTVGALGALSEVEGYNPQQCDVVVGTSAGSVVAALLGCGVPVEDLVERLVGHEPQHVVGTGPVNPFDVHAALAAVPWPVLLPGNLRLAMRTVGRPRRHTMMTLAAGLAPRGRGDLGPLAEMIDEAEGGHGWPVAPVTWVVAMDYDSGKRVVFGRADAPTVPLADAVTASCAAPGFFPPVRIGRSRYVDGGAVSVTNADVLLRDDLDEILVLAPMATGERTVRRSAAGRAEGRLRRHFTAQLDIEVGRLRATGTAVRVLVPTAEDRAAMGLNVMDPRRRREVLEVALRTTREQLTRSCA